MGPVHALIVSLVCASSAIASDIAREGSREHRAMVDQLEGTAAPDVVIGSLEDWRNGSVSPADTDGKPVLLVTWSSWYRTSHGALSIAQDLAKKYEGDGLLVIGIHHPKGWERAEEIIERKGVSFPYAWDKKGTSRRALRNDSDPDFYVIDRAGKIRFADITTHAVETAVDLVVSETFEAAANARDGGADAGDVGDAGISPGAQLRVPFDLPADGAYADIDWPGHAPAGGLSAQNFQGRSLPAPLGNETYIGTRPDTKGRVIVLDFWATWCGPCKVAMPRLDAMHEQYGDDVAIIGISNESQSKVKTFLKRSPHKYYQAVDRNNTVANAMRVRGIPHIVVISSDGVVRWQGNPLRDEAALRKAIETCIRVDPGVAARKAAEQEYLRSLNG